MVLKATQVSKCLDKKLILLGFEVPDLLAVLLVMSVLNFIFGRTGMTIPLVWAPTILLALLLRIGKRGKPDNYLIHWLRYQFKPGVLKAFLDPSVQKTAPGRKGEVNEK